MSRDGLSRVRRAPPLPGSGEPISGQDFQATELSAPYSIPALSTSPGFAPRMSSFRMERPLRAAHPEGMLASVASTYSATGTLNCRTRFVVQYGNHLLGIFRLRRLFRRRSSLRGECVTSLVPGSVGLGCWVWVCSHNVLLQVSGTPL